MRGKIVIICNQLDKEDTERREQAGVMCESAIVQ
jgi:hypothetical protein